MSIIKDFFPETVTSEKLQLPKAEMRMGWSPV